MMASAGEAPRDPAGRMVSCLAENGFPGTENRARKRAENKTVRFTCFARLESAFEEAKAN